MGFHTPDSSTQEYQSGRQLTESKTQTKCSSFSDYSFLYTCLVHSILFYSNLLLYCVLFSPSDACELTLDPNTAHRKLLLSEDNRKVTVREEQPYPDHPERFDCCDQLLCRNGLTGRCYWEVERKGGVHIGVTYRGISRRGGGEDCRLGGDETSWSLDCFANSYSACHNNRPTVMPSPSSSDSDRVAVYLDWPAGSLSFYRVSSDTLIHIHTFHSTFTEPLYPGFGFWSGPGSSVSLCQIEERETLTL
ncbi:stonustoxin subunit beta-like [Centroberyx gerrardi]